MLRAIHDVDARISNAAYRRGLQIPRSLYKFLEFTGDGLVWLALTISCCLSWSITPDIRAVWANMLLGLLIDLAEVGVAKFSCRRSRPEYNAHAGDMVVIVAVDHYSFPSGHSSRASFVMTYAAVVLWKTRPDVVMAICIWAISLALSRCAMGRHYMGDVIAGLALGVVTTGVLTRWMFDLDSMLLSTKAVDEMYGTLSTYAWQLFQYSPHQA